MSLSELGTRRSWALAADSNEGNNNSVRASVGSGLKRDVMGDSLIGKATYRGNSAANEGQAGRPAHL